MSDTQEITMQVLCCGDLVTINGEDLYPPWSMVWVPGKDGTVYNNAHQEVMTLADGDGVAEDLAAMGVHFIDLGGM